MESKLYVGVVGCDMTEDFFRYTTSLTADKYIWKKALPLNDTAHFITSRYPKIEIVENIQAIVEDSSISLVLVSSNHLHYVSKFIEAGKSVRII